MLWYDLLLYDDVLNTEAVLENAILPSFWNTSSNCAELKHLTLGSALFVFQIHRNKIIVLCLT
jgi:hypothetical protein